MVVSRQKRREVASGLAVPRVVTARRPGVWATDRPNHLVAGPRVFLPQLFNRMRAIFASSSTALIGASTRSGTTVW